MFAEGRKVGKICSYIEPKKPGERIAIDLLEIDKKCKIILAVDYFTRMLFGKVVQTKEANKILVFLEKLHKKFPFKMMTVDNGKEFCNDDVKRWAEKKNVDVDFSIPYYHPSNGRIERANRTIREACKKIKGITKIKLKNILNNYNHLRHRAVGMSPIEALESKN